MSSGKDGVKTVIGDDVLTVTDGNVYIGGLFIACGSRIQKELNIRYEDETN